MKLRSQPFQFQVTHLDFMRFELMWVLVQTCPHVAT